jgi:hypothetical protein
MAERVIDTFEAVQIQIHNRNGITSVPRIGEHRGGRLNTPLAIRESGQDIHVSQALDVLCGCGTFGCVLANDYDVATFAARKPKLV